MEHSLTKNYIPYMKQRKDFPEYRNMGLTCTALHNIDINIGFRVFEELTDKILWDIIIRFFRRIGLESLGSGIKYYIRVKMSAGFGDDMPVYWFHIDRMIAVNIDDYEAGKAEEKEMNAVFKSLYLDVVSEICVDWKQSHKDFLKLSQAAIVMYRARSYYCMSEEEAERYKKSMPWYKEEKEEAKMEIEDADLVELEALETELDYSMTEEEQMADVASQIIEAVTKPREDTEEPPGSAAS